jgi:uncharacterized membrane protein YhhN
MRSKNAHLLFWLVSILEIVGRFFDWSLVFFTKPLLMPLLLLWFLLKAKSLKSNGYFLVIGALIFSWLGDLLLMFDGREIFFILGLASFLIAHIFYVLVFSRLMEIKFTFGKLRWTFLMPLMVYAGFLFYLLIPASGQLAPAILLYGITILTMLFFAISRKGFTNVNSYQWVAIGALFFVISDSLLGINKFYESLPLASILIMFTYILGQYFIVKGCLKHSVH